jgi:hypothetical protein
VSTLSAKALCYACITHVPPIVRFPAYVKTIYLGAVQAPGHLNLRDLAPRWDQYHSLIGGSAGSFALRNYILLQQPETLQVGVCQYRKFMTRTRIGTPATNYQVMDVITRTDVKDDILAECMLPNDHEFLTVKPAQFAMNGINYGYLYQYKDVHHVQDLLRFTAMAAELGVLDKQEVIPFLDEKVFMAGGVEIGIFPAAFWLATIGAVEAVTWECIQHYDVRREGAQARLWAYCIERLGSYLLLKQLRALHGAFAWMDTCTGQLNLIVEEDVGGYVPGV